MLEQLFLGLNMSLRVSPPCHLLEHLLILLDLALKVLALDQVGDIVLIVGLLALLHILVRLGELAERGEGVGAKLVEDAGDELGELLVLAVAVDGKGVGGDRGVDCCNCVVSIEVE